MARGPRIHNGSGNRRAEMFWGLREVLERGKASLPDDDDVRADVSALHYVFTQDGRIQIEGKDEGRTFPFRALPQLEQLLQDQYTRTRTVERETGRIVAHVFHRAGEPISCPCVARGTPRAAAPASQARGSTISGVPPSYIWNGPVCRAPSR